MEKDVCYPLFGLCVSNKIDLSLMLTIAIFVATIVINGRIDRTKREKDKNEAEKQSLATRRKYLVALSEEIGLNVESLEKSISDFPARPDLVKFLSSSKRKRPLITFSYYSIIYKTRTEVLQDLPEILVRSIVEFYGKLDSISIDCDSVSLPAFITISNAGREATLSDLESDQKVALQHGKSIRDGITQHLRDAFPRK